VYGPPTERSPAVGSDVWRGPKAGRAAARSTVFKDDVTSKGS
jgi:hypothetical protein